MNTLIIFSLLYPPLWQFGWRCLHPPITPVIHFSYTSSSSFWPQALPPFAPFHLTSQWDQTGLSGHGMTGEGVGMTDWTGPNTFPDRQAGAERLRVRKLRFSLRKSASSFLLMDSLSLGEWNCLLLPLNGSTVYSCRCGGRGFWTWELKGRRRRGGDTQEGRKTLKRGRRR